jgi:soluble lytic murein transglycosylase-like protein
MTGPLRHFVFASLMVAAAGGVARARGGDDPAVDAMRRVEAAVLAAERAGMQTESRVEPPANAHAIPVEPATSIDTVVATGSPDLDRIVADASASYGVDRGLVVAMIRQESGFRARAVSPKGAAGYMQLMPATARRFGVTDVFDARQNVHAGVRYLRVLLDLFGGDRELALAAYNAGEGRVGAVIDRTGVRRFGEMARRGLLPAETRAYVPAIMARAGRLGDGLPLARGGESGRRVDAPASLRARAPAGETPEP